MGVETIMQPTMTSC